MIHPRPALAAVILGLSLSAACLPGAIPPRVPARSALALGGAIPSPPAATKGPLAVIFAAPRGETAQVAEIAVAFSKPMRALGLGPSDPAPPIAMRPVAKGAFHWLGSTTLRFDAEEALAPATTYHVEIPAGTRALDGSTLAEAFAFEFTTPRASVVESHPGANETDVAPDSTVTLVFDQAVADAEILRAVSIRGEKAAAPIPFTITRRGPTRVELVPARKLPLADRVHVRVDASLRAEGGELPAGKDRDIAFTTVGPPSVRRWSCEPHPDDQSACNPEYGRITLELSGAVPRGALARAIEIDPPVKWDHAEYQGDDPIDQLSIFGDFKPGATYRVRLAPGAKLIDWSGQRLAPDAPRTLRFDHLPARTRFGLRGTYWSTRQRHAFEAWATNTSAADVHVVPRSLDDVLQLLGGGTASRPLGPALTIAEPPLDGSAHRAVDVDQLLPGPRGAIDLVTRYTPRDRAAHRTAEHRIQITDLGLTARVGHGSAAVLVADLEDARPAAGAEVALYRAPRDGAPSKRLGVATTGPQGEAAITFDDAITKKDKLILAARRGADWSYHEIKPPRAPEAEGMLYSERGIYRPGETVKISGVLRVPGPAGLVTPRGAPVHVTVRSRGSDPIAEIDTTLSEFGTLAVDVPIPREAPVGGYAAQANMHDVHVFGSFYVSEYRPTEIAVDATTDRTEHTRGDTLRCGVRARYLHGGAMAGAKATVVVSRSASSYDVPGLPGFTTRDIDRSLISGDIGYTRGKLDAQGSFTFPVTLALPGQTGPESVGCAVEVMDLNRQALGAQAGTLVHPGELYVALADPDHRQVAPGTSLAAEVLAVTPAGERRATKVHVEIVRRDNDETKETVVTTCDVTTGSTPARCAFTVPKDAPNDARIVVRANVTDRHGNMARTSYLHWVVVPPKTPPRREPPPSPPTPSLHIATDRRYTVGQTGHVTIDSPYLSPATALVTVEREGILWQRVVQVPGPSARVEFPITEAMIPNASVSVMMISGRKHERSGDSFEVDAAGKHLAVTVETSGGEAHRPGEAIDVDVQVKDASGKPTRAEVTLWAADEGSLSLIGYGLPDPWNALQGWRSTLVTEAESREDLVYVGLGGFHRSKPPQIRMGATQTSPPRGDFRQTAFFAAHLVTDDAGRLRRRFTLPDGLTTYRVMAVAVAADDRAGSGKTQVVTSLPLMARATLPRIVRAGDRFEASVVVSGTAAEGDAVVSAEVSGVTLTSDARRTLHLAKDTPAEVRFAVRADRAGPARLTFRATLGKLSDATVLDRDVVTPIVPESASIDGETRDAAAEALGDLSSIRPDYGGLEVSLSTTPLAGLADGIEQLVEYPYGCTEQTVSRLVPLLALRDLAVALGASLPADTRRAAEEAVARLTSHQRADGSFGLWRESSRSEPWLTAWALWGLGEARQRGLTVPPKVEDRARAYLREAMAPAPDGEAARLALAAFVADINAEGGHPDAELTAHLFAARDRLPPFSRALLLHALALAKSDPSHLKDLTRDLEAVLRLDGASARAVVESHLDRTFDSDTRTTAMILRALVAVDPAHPLVPRLARGLLEARRGGRFRTTHEAAWALLALDDVRRARPAPAGDTTARVFLGDALLREVDLRERQDHELRPARGLPPRGQRAAARLHRGGPAPLPRPPPLRAPRAAGRSCRVRLLPPPHHAPARRRRPRAPRGHLRRRRAGAGAARPRHALAAQRRRHRVAAARRLRARRRRHPARGRVAAQLGEPLARDAAGAARRPRALLRRRSARRVDDVPVRGSRADAGHLRHPAGTGGGDVRARHLRADGGRDGHRRRPVRPFTPRI
ncbi:MAG: MG2 domain-containing protein [Minicystis sp.]